MNSRWITATLLSVLTLGTVACSNVDTVVTGPGTVTTAEEATAGSSLVVHPHNDGGPTALLTGTLLAEDCVILRHGGEDYVTIFPDRAELRDDGVEFDGELLRFGTIVQLGGGEAAAEHLEEYGAHACGLDAGYYIGSLAGINGSN